MHVCACIMPERAGAMLVGVCVCCGVCVRACVLVLPEDARACW